MYRGLGAELGIESSSPNEGLATSSDPAYTPGPAETTTLHLGGGYAGQPVISPTTSGGYQGVTTVTSNVSVGAQVGNWLSNNLLMAGLGLFGLVFMVGGRRR